MASRKIEALSVDVNGDIHGLAKAMNDAVALLNNTKKAVNEVNKAIANDPNDISHLKDKVKIYEELVKRNREAQKSLEEQARFLMMQKDFGENSYISKEFQSLLTKISECEKNEKAFNKELEETKLKISNFTFDQKMNALNEKLKETEKSLSKVRESLTDVNKKIELDPSNISLYEEKHRLLAQTLDLSKKRLADLKKEAFWLSSAMFHKQTDKDREALEKVNKEIEKETVNIDKLQKALGNSPEMEKFLSDCTNLGNALEVVSNKTRRFSQAMKTLLGTAFNSSVSYESGIANIRKVVGDLSDDTVEDLKNIAIETGNAFEKVSEYATIAGALGLTNEELAKFSKTMLDLNAVSNGAFSGEEGAKGIAVFLKQLNLGIDQAENFGSVIAVIGDKYADIGSETVDVATKLTGLNSIVKTNQYELLGLAGVMSDLGLSTSSNANAINRSFLQIDKILSGGVKDWETKLKSIATTAGMSASEFRKAWGENAVDSFLKFTDGLRSSVFNDINKAIKTSDAEVTKFADTLGLSASQFKKAWNEDSLNVFNRYVEALGELGEEGESASSSLAQAGLSSVFVAQTLLRLSGNGNKVREAISLANTAWNENTALMEKSNILYDTTERKIEAFKESWNQLSASFVDVFLPAIKNVLDDLTQLFKKLKNSDETVKSFVTSFALFGASISPVTRVLGVFLKTIGKAHSEFGDLDRDTQMLIKGYKALGGGLGVGAIAVTTALIGGTVALGKYLDKTDSYSKRLANVRDSILGSVDAFEELKTSLSNSMVMFDYQSAFYDRNVEKVQELVDALKTEGMTDDEIKEKRLEIAEALGKVNEQLGTTYSYDEKKNAIKNEQGDVVDLISSYEDLILERRKAFFLEQSMGAYNEALENQKKAYDAIADAKWEYAQATKDVDEAMIAFSQAYAKNPMSQDVLEVYDKLDGKQKALVVSLADAYLKAKGVVDESDELISQSQTLIGNVDAIAGSSGKTLENYLDMMKNGFNIDPAKNDLDEMREKLEKVNFLLANPQGLSQDTIAGLSEQKTSLEEQISATEEALRRATEINDANRHNHVSLLDEMDDEKDKFNEITTTDSDSILNTSEMAWDEIVAKVQESSTLMADDYKTKMQNASSEISSFISSNPIHQDVIITYKGLNLSNGKTTSGGGGVGPYLPYSGGFVEGVMGSLRNSLGNQNRLMAGSVTLNASFTINNGQNITPQVLEGWADAMTDRINDNLGKMYD